MKIQILFILLLSACAIKAQEIGIQLYSVRNEVKKDLKGTLQKVRAMGIKELEGGELYGMNIQDYKKMLDEMGYKMVSIGVDYEAMKGDLSKTISDAKALGATYVVCFWIGHNGNEFGMKEVDVFWAKQGCADPVAILKKYPSRMKMLHLKDREHGTVCNDTGGADEETNVVLGKGDVNIKGVMKAARKAGVKHYFIEDESTRVMQQVPQSLQYLKSLK
jgi:sugar phosphate isomerase/epimerase